MTELSPDDPVGAFVLAVHPVLAPLGNYQHGPMGGHEYRWSNELGVWAVHVGGAVDVGPLIIGPGGNHWLTTAYTLRCADLVLLMLELAGAIPMAEKRPALPVAGTVVDARAVPAPAPPGLVAPVDVRAGVLAGDEIAGSDLPARGGPAAIFAEELGDRARDLSAGVLRRLPTVLGGGGLPEYASDGKAYEGDRVMPATLDDPGWQVAPWPGERTTGDLAGEPGPGVVPRE